MSYALEGSCFIAGAAIGFLRDNLHMINHAKETSEISEDTEAAPQIYFVPALTGLGAPYWKPKARGILLGLTRSTTKEQIIKATLEGICFQVEDLLATFKKESGLELKELCVDGGATANEILMKTQSYLSQLKILRPEILESTAYGAALISAYGSGFIKSLEDLKKQKTIGKSFDVKLTQEEQEQRKEKLEGWKKAVSLLL
jgi:glycerol kinase